MEQKVVEALREAQLALAQRLEKNAYDDLPEALLAIATIIERLEYMVERQAFSGFPVGILEGVEKANTIE